MRAELAASVRKELLVGIRSWRVLAYSLFLAAVVLLGAYLPADSFPYEVALSQGPLLLLLVLGCAFIFAVDSVSREHERGTAPLVFGWQVLAALGSATMLFLAVLGLMLLVSAAVRGRGAPFAGLVVVLFIFFSSGYFPAGIAEGVRWLSPGYHGYLVVTDLGDGALDSALPLAVLAAEAAVFMLLAYWAFRQSEVSR